VSARHHGPIRRRPARAARAKGLRRSVIPFPGKAAAIIVAGGSGSRMGRPKQFLPLAGRPCVEWALEAFLQVPEISDIVLVLGEEDLLAHGTRLASERVSIVQSGETRMGSVRNGFEALPERTGLVAVHDGARPLVSPDVIRRTLAAAARHGAAVAAVKVKDTLKQADPSGERVTSTPPRERFWQAQTPQCYRRTALAEALARHAADKLATDESQLVERCGYKVHLVSSSYENLKVTTPEDLTMAEALLEARQGLRRELRTGHGYDIHRLVPKRALWLAGVRLKHPKGLLGHSDADVVLHAASDAVLGALCEGEIGIAFPPTDPAYKDIASRRIVEHVLKRAAAKNAELLHLDVTVIAEEPKLKPHYAELRGSLAEIFRLDVSRVNVKAKSAEGLDAVGRGDAIVCHAIATVAVRI
jgi:2-C-methyl-D-erythritol 4-phosphate cytidylyltransferase/2-C-methyl-D-erythritol 2,4-cyclodiphosphate synthase